MVHDHVTGGVVTCLRSGLGVMGMAVGVHGIVCTESNAGSPFRCMCAVGTAAVVSGVCANALSRMYQSNGKIPW